MGLVAFCCVQEMTIKQLGEALDALKAEISELQVQLKRAGEDREKQNKELSMLMTQQRLCMFRRSFCCHVTPRGWSG